MTSLDNKLLPQAQCLLQRRLPAQWELRVQDQGGATYWEIQAPEGQRGQLRVQTYTQLTPSQLRGVEADVVAVRYASPSLQAACRERGVGYVDLTGNVGVELRSRAVASMCLEPRGLEVLVSKLSQGLAEAVVTGSLAAQSWAPLAGARLAQVYVPDLARAREVLGLREVERGANVMLLEPHDPAALWGSARAESGLRVAAVCQVVADLWSGPGRGPQEAQALLQWMAEHEAQWRNLDYPPAQEP